MQFFTSSNADSAPNRENPFKFDSPETIYSGHTTKLHEFPIDPSGKDVGWKGLSNCDGNEYLSPKPQNPSDDTFSSATCVAESCRSFSKSIVGFFRAPGAGHSESSDSSKGSYNSQHPKSLGTSSKGSTPEVQGNSFLSFINVGNYGLKEESTNSKKNKKKDVKKKSKKSFKTKLYTTAACTAFASTAALVTTATVLTPLLPVVLPLVLPVSVATNGIVIFKAKKALSKLKKRVKKPGNKKGKKNMKHRILSIKNKSKCFFKKKFSFTKKNKNLANQKAKKSESPFVSEPVLLETEEDIKTTTKNHFAYRDPNFSKYYNFLDSKQEIQGDDIKVSCTSSKPKGKKRRARKVKKPRPVFVFPPSSSDDESELGCEKNVFEKYFVHTADLDTFGFKDASINTNLIRKPEGKTKTTSPVIADSFSSSSGEKYEAKTKITSVEDSIPNNEATNKAEQPFGFSFFDFNNLSMSSPNLDTVKQTAANICSIFMSQ